MKLDDLKQGINSAWDSVTDGLQRIKESAAGSLTRFRPGEKDTLPANAEVDDDAYLPSASWAMLAGDVFEDDTKVVVRLEVPGMEKEQFDIQVQDNSLLVSGEKRFEREQTEGRYRTFECAYGSFQRSIRLPAPVKSEEAKANYRNGILRIELPKEKQEKPKARTIKID
ncbi:Hsp20/alpha crystallin family protein [Propionivibrio soli]|uniref:Hsp20/alpha crystallin family protein n=1 Tax=Propionivibrio soli TaxID=2976531 RepID=UPI0021E71644|nr:Hsp20/alpha crystallin family protein [Propionivibrio soli]